MVDQVQPRQPMAWDPEQLTDQANELANTTASRNPAEYPWGLFFWGDAPPACGGGTGCFQWFASLQDALGFISDFSPAMYATFDEEPEWIELRDALRAMSGTASGTRTALPTNHPSLGEKKANSGNAWRSTGSRDWRGLNRKPPSPLGLCRDGVPATAPVVQCESRSHSGTTSSADPGPG